MNTLVSDCVSPHLERETLGLPHVFEDLRGGSVGGTLGRIAPLGVHLNSSAQGLLAKI